MHKRIHALLTLIVCALCAITGSAQAQGRADAQELALSKPMTVTAMPRTVSDIVELLKSYSPDPTGTEQLKKLTQEQPPQTSDRRLLAAFYRLRADANWRLGLAQEYLADYREALRVGGNVGDMKGQLATAEYNIGNYQAAIKLRQELSEADGTGGGSYTILAWFLASAGDVETAKRYLGLAEAWNDAAKRSKAWETWQHLYRSNLARGKFHVFLAEGKFADAEAAARDAVQAMGKLVEPSQLRMKESLGFNPRYYRGILANDEGRLAKILALRGNLAEAELWARNSLSHNMDNDKGITILTGRSLLVLAETLAEQGRLVEAELISRLAIETLEKVGVVPQAAWLVEARLARANVLVALGSWNEAVAEFSRRRDALLRDPHWKSLGVEEPGWAVALFRSGQQQQAKAMLEVLEQRLATRYGSEHYDVAEVRGFLGVALSEMGQQRAALASFRKAMEGLLARHGKSDSSRSPAKSLRLNIILEAYIGLLHDIKGTAMEADARVDATAEAFSMADAMRGQSTQRAMAAAGARAGAAANPKLAKLIRTEQDLSHESDSLLEILVRLSAAPKEQQLPNVIANMRERVAVIAKERKELGTQIEKGFPEYANLIQPRLVTLPEVRGLLKPGEVLLSIFPGTTRNYVWAVPKDGPVAFYASKLSAAEITQSVQNLRQALDIDNAAQNKAPGFDVAAAYKLYESLLLPVRDSWSSATSMLVATNGALAQIPFAILPTEEVKLSKGKVLFDEYQAVPWLVRQLAIAQLPSVNALVTLRTMPAGSKTRLEFAGFGDPVFDSRAPVMAAKSAPERVAMRDLAIPRVSEEAIRQNQTVSAIPYSRLPPLPDTRDEVLAIAKALKADPARDVFLGQDASKAKLLSTDLASRRTIAFATHGLLAGDFPGVDQPALALAAPPDGSAESDPLKALLTLDDILMLKLDADWVVLSACNTAAGDGKGSEAISGLGRAFFYAGSRALLVTHWPVDSYSARLLVAGVFDRYTAEPGLTRAQALQASMLSLMKDVQTDQSGRPQYSFAHPMFWAPYALVGDSGR